jgi:hypothetical protein
VNGLLTRLLNASAALQRATAGALFLGVILAVVVVVVGMAGALGSKQEELHELRERAGRFARVAALKEVVRAVDTPQEEKDGQALFMEAESPAIARATLQSRIGAFSRQHKVAVVSAGGLPDRDENGYKLIGLRANLVGPFENVHAMILAMESSLPPMFIRELVLKRAGQPQSEDEPVIQMTAQLQLYVAYRRAEVAAAEPPRQAELTQ